MEREGEAAGGRSMQRLILCVCVFVRAPPGRTARRSEDAGNGNRACLVWYVFIMVCE